MLTVFGYVSKQEKPSRAKGLIIALSFMLGTALILSIIGAIGAAIGKLFLSYSLGKYVPWVTLVIGIYLVLGLKIRLPKSKKLGLKVGETGGAFFLGMPFGIIGSPCTVPLILAILAMVAAKGNIFYGALAMFVYAIGRSIILLIIGTFTGFIKNLIYLTRYSKYLEKLVGLFIIITSLYLIPKI